MNIKIKITTKLKKEREYLLKNILKAFWKTREEQRFYY